MYNNSVQSRFAQINFDEVSGVIRFHVSCSFLNISLVDVGANSRTSYLSSSLSNLIGFKSGLRVDQYIIFKYYAPNCYKYFDSLNVTFGLLSCLNAKF